MKVGISTIAKDEDNYLPFWIAWHLSIGFDRILIHNHESAHPCLEKVDHSKVSIRPAERTYRCRTLQEDTNLAGSDQLLGLCDWVFFLDVDEFFLPRAVSETPGKYLGWAPVEAGQIVFNSQVFAKSNANLHLPIVRRNTIGAIQDHPSSEIVKHAVRPEALIEAGCHRSLIHDDYITVAADLSTRVSGELNNAREETVFWHPRILHYPVKSDIEWARKVARGYEWQQHVRRTEDKLKIYDPHSMNAHKVVSPHPMVYDIAARAESLVASWG